MPILKGVLLGGHAWEITVGPTAGTVGTVTPPPSTTYATAFTETLSSAAGRSGSPVTITVAPVTKAWPSGETLTFSAATLAGTFSPASVTPVVGSTTPLTSTFTPTSAAGTTGTIKVTAVTMTNQSGPQGYSITATTASGYTLTQASTSGYVGQADTLTMTPTPTGTAWPSGNITLTSTLAGSFSPNNIVAMPVGTGGSLTVGYTPSAAGTATINATNNAGLTPPSAITYTVSVASGSAAAITNNTAFLKRRVFNRDVYSGNPPGFTTTYGKGWGAVPITISLSAPVTTGLFLRLHNAMDSAAVSTTPGTGAVLQPTIQVSGVTNIPAGTSTISLTIPAALAWYYADVGLDAAMTNPTRIPLPFGVGSVTVIIGTSHSGSMSSNFAYTSSTMPPVSSQVAISPFGVQYTPNEPVTFSGYDGTGFDAGAAQVPGDYTTSAYPSVGSAEYLRLCCAKLGVVCAWIGQPMNGGSLDYWNPTDTDLRRNWAQLAAVLAQFGWKFDAFLSIQCQNDTGWMFPSIAWMSHRMRDQLGALSANAAAPFAAILCTTPIWGGNANSSYYRMGMLANHDVARMSTSNTLVNHDWSDGNACAGFSGAYIGGHSSPLSKVRMARQFYRYVMGALGPAKGGFTQRRGPAITSATRTGAVITLTVAHDGGTALKYYWRNEGNISTSTAETQGFDKASADFTQLFTVYGAGLFYDNNAGSSGQYALSDVTITSPNTITVTLSADPGAGVALDLYFALDLNPLNGPRNVPAIKDDTNDGDGITYGRDMQRTVDPIYVPPPTPAAQAITIATPADTATGAWIFVNGTGAGTPLPGAQSLLPPTPATSIEVSVAGGPYVVPSQLVVDNSNKWSGFLPAPASVVSGATISARRVGQVSADASATINVIAARDTLTAATKASAVVMYDASNIGTLFSDTAGTIPAVQMGPVRCWKDALGTASNTLTQGNADPKYAPFVDQRVPNLNHYIDHAQWRPSVHTEIPGRLVVATAPAFVSSLTGDFTIMFIYRAHLSSNNYWSIGKSTGAPSYGNAATPAAISCYGSGGINISRAGNTGVVSTGYDTRAACADPGRLGLVVARYSNTTGILRLWQKTASYGTSLSTGAETSTTALTDLSAVSFDTFVLGGNLGAYSLGIGEGRIYEFTAWSRQLTDAERDGEITRAINKWGNG